LGQDHMTTNEVVVLARETIAKLGYKPELAQSGEMPEISGPFDLHRQGWTNEHVPYCQITWNWPKERREYLNPNELQVEINLDTKQMVGFLYIPCRTNIFKTVPLKVNVVPELESNYKKRMQASGIPYTNTLFFNIYRGQ
jgi:hypothetical protein